MRIEKDPWDWYMGVSRIGVPQNGWFIMENPIKMDDLGVPLFSETSIFTYTNFVDFYGFHVGIGSINQSHGSYGILELSALRIVGTMLRASPWENPKPHKFPIWLQGSLQKNTETHS